MPERASSSDLTAAKRMLIRDIAPVTPLGLEPKAIAGDPIHVSATLVADGHDILCASVQWRRVDDAPSWPAPGSSWCDSELDVDEFGVASGDICIDEPGVHEFRIIAGPDRFATWHRDLLLRSGAGEDLAIEFAEGALIIDALMDLIAPGLRARVTAAVETLRNPTCSESTKLRLLDDPLLVAVLVGRRHQSEETISGCHPLRVDRELAAFSSWYELFPRSVGGFVRGSQTWDRLAAVAEAGFDVLYLPPVHPIGVTNRKGRNNSLDATPDDVGSPWAIGSVEGGHEALDPALGEMSDFLAFVGRASEMGVQIALDFALQCSPDHPWVSEHPEWFNHRVDGSIRYAENPPKKYQDIYPINFWPEREGDRIALWNACHGILETWIERGISVFRVDNPHTKPLSFWRWLITRVQRDHPGVVFLSEAFTDPPMMHSLAEIGFTQSYTYFTWRHGKAELTSYGEELARGPASDWFRPNLWPTTPDILTGVLRNGSSDAFRSRALLAATLSPSWGVYSGYELCEGDPHPTKEEYDRSEKYELKDRDFDDPSSIWGFISDLNHIRRRNPALHRMASLAFHDVDNDDVIAYSHVARVADGWNRVLVVASLAPDATREATVHLDRSALRLDDGGPIYVSDELTGGSWNWSGYGDYVRLGPADRVGHIFTVEYGPR